MNASEITNKVFRDKTTSKEKHKSTDSLRDPVPLFPLSRPRRRVCSVNKRQCLELSELSTNSEIEGGNWRIFLPEAVVHVHVGTTPHALSHLVHHGSFSTERQLHPWPHLSHHPPPWSTGSVFSSPRNLDALPTHPTRPHYSSPPLLALYMHKWTRAPP